MVSIDRKEQWIGLVFSSSSVPRVRVFGSFAHQLLKKKIVVIWYIFLHMKIAQNSWYWYPILRAYRNPRIFLAILVSCIAFVSQLIVFFLHHINQILLKHERRQWSDIVDAVCILYLVLFDKFGVKFIIHLKMDFSLKLSAILNNYF